MRVTSKGQVTIPKHIREKLGITPTTEIDFFVEGKHVFLEKRKKATNRKFAKQRGVAPAIITTDSQTDLPKENIKTHHRTSP